MTELSILMFKYSFLKIKPVIKQSMSCHISYWNIFNKGELAIVCHDSLLEYCQGGAPDVASQTSLAGEPSLTTIISWGCVTILGGVRTFTTLQNSSQLTTTDLDGVVELGEVEG